MLLAQVKRRGGQEGWGEADPDRDRHRRHLHRRGGPGRGHRRAGHHQDAVDPGRSVGGLPDRAGQGARTSRCHRRGRVVGEPRHHGRHQPAAAGRHGAAGVHHHRGVRLGAGDRPPVGSRRLRQLLLLGQAAADRAGGSGQDGRRAAGPHRRRRCGRSTRSGAAEVARWFRDRGVDTIGVCFLHAYADPAHELAMREVLAREHPGGRRVDLLATCCGNTANTSAR